MLENHIKTKNSQLINDGNVSELFTILFEIFNTHLVLEDTKDNAFKAVSEYASNWFENNENIIEQEALSLKSTCQDIFFMNLDLSETIENTHVAVGKYLIYKIKSSHQMDAEANDNPLIRKSSGIFTQFDDINPKRSKPDLDHTQRFSIEYTDGVNGDQFFWYQTNDESFGSDLSDSSSQYSFDEGPPIYSRLSQQETPTPTINTALRLHSHNEHFEFLKKAIRNADNGITISSYGISIGMLKQLEEEIKRAISIGIPIFFYNSDQKSCSPAVMAFIKKHNIIYQKIRVHSKVVAIDNNTIAVGSYNWLSSDGQNYNNGLNGTIVLSGEEYCRGLRSQFMVFLRQYIHKKNGNSNAVNNFKNIGTTDMPVYFDQQNKSRLTYLASLNSHRKFLDSLFHIAQTSITICCPFINEQSGFLEDLPVQKICKTANRGVKITFICNHANESLLKSIYGPILSNHRNISVISTHNLHNKSIVVDEHLIAEGSFNWLSASRDENSAYHNHELTMVCEGPMAKPLIDDFNKSMLLSDTPKEKKCLSS